MERINLNQVLKNTTFAYGFFSIVLDEKGAPIDFIIHDANERFNELTGYDISQVKDKKASEVFPGILLDDHDWLSDFSYTALSGKTKVVEAFSRYFDKWFRVEIICPLERHFVTFFSDISKEKYSTKSVENFFEVNLDLLCISDLEGHFIKLNKKWEDVLGYKEDELEGKLFLEFVHPEDKPSTISAFSDLSDTKKVFNFVNRYIRKDGDFRWIEWRSFIYGDRIYSSARDITQRINTEQENATLLMAVKQAAESVLITDLEANIEYVNPAFERLSGYRKEEVIGENARILKSGFQDPSVYKKMWETLDKDMIWEGEFKNKRKDGSIYIEEVKISPVFDSNGKKINYIAVKHDITQRRDAENNLRQSEELLDMFFRQSLDGFFFMMLPEPIKWDDSIDKDKAIDYVFKEQKITKINKAMLEQYRAKENDFIGLTPIDFFKHDVENGKRIWKDFFDKGKLHIDTREKRFDGSDMMIEGDYICIYDHRGYIKGHFGIQRDVTDLKETRRALEKSEQKFKELSMMDYLTSLYNRRHIFERIEELIERKNRFSETFSIAIIDLDHFKDVNDKYGHRAGDKVLRSIAKLLKSQVRKYDVVGRYGGEEFIILFPEINREEALPVMERIKGFAQEMKIVHENNEMFVTFSCGIADIEEIKNPKKRMDMIVEKADNRLYLAKENGRNKIVVEDK